MINSKFAETLLYKNILLIKFIWEYQKVTKYAIIINRGGMEI